MNGSQPAGMLLVLQHLAVALARHVAAQRRAGHSPPTEVLALADVLREAVTARQEPSMCACAGSDDHAADMGDPLLLKIGEAAHLLGVSRSTLERLLRAGDLPAVKVGAGVRVRRADLSTYIAALPPRADEVASARQRIAGHTVRSTA